MSDLIAILPAADYLYLCRFSSREETRYYLNGTFVDVAGKRLVATDCRRLGLLDMSGDMWAAEGAKPFILSNAKALQAACKAARSEVVWLRCFSDRVDIIKHASSLAFTAEDLGETNVDAAMSFPAKTVYVDGTFPDYLRVLPRTCSGQMFDADESGKVTNAYGFNSTYVATFAAPGKRQTMVTLMPNGGSPALCFNSDRRFLGVLMPTREGLLPADAVSRIDAFFPEAAAEEARAA